MEKKKIDRREFLKLFGTGAAAATAGFMAAESGARGLPPPLSVKSRPTG